MEKIITIAFIWGFSALMIFFPVQILKTQEDIYKIFGKEYKYTDTTIKVIQLMGLILVGIGFYLIFYS